LLTAGNGDASPSGEQMYGKGLSAMRMFGARVRAICDV
jgi:hypothetical protein